MKPRHWRRFAAAAAFLCGLTACTTQQRHTWLTVFFEGVPPLGSESAHETATPGLGKGQGTPVLVSTNAELPWIIHAPYKTRKCDACHTADRSQSLKGSQRDICLPCHTNVISGAEVLHWPLKKGKCMVCHQPHLSLVAKLLTKPGVALCNDCHTPMNKKQVVHEPVRRGRCQSCHTAHESPYRGLLKTSGDALCERCHEPAPMKAVAGHADVGDQACLDCHDPHQTDAKGLLKHPPPAKEPPP